MTDVTSKTLDWAVAQSFARENAHPDTHIPAILTPNNVGVTSLERYQDRPSFHRGLFHTTRIVDFLEYLSVETLGAMTGVFISPEGTGAQAVIDLGDQEDPMWGYHKARLALKKTPEYQAVLKACESPVSQRDMITFLEDNYYFMSAFVKRSSADEDEEPTASTIGAAIQIIRQTDLKAKIESQNNEEDFSQTRTGMESISAHGRGGANVTRLRANLSPYEDTKDCDIDIRIVLRTAGDKPMFSLSIVAPSLIDIAVREELEQRITEAEGLSAVRIFVGKYEGGQHDSF